MAAKGCLRKGLIRGWKKWMEGSMDLSDSVPYQVQKEKFALLFPLSTHCQRTLLHIHKHKGEAHFIVWGCDMQLLLCAAHIFQEEVRVWNYIIPLPADFDPTTLSIPVSKS